ncbi:MAG TPA: hypothetical protein ENG31_03970 [Candidatus Thorarchaeota archaeon]|nr:MAG: hypothetical protein DRO93_03135 [Candidatus Thorarchaeota archaeon]HDD67757.1 hypothetical protein [Candidatus Thorarchaeota archaeon]
MRRTIQSMAVMMVMILCIVTCASSLEIPPGITVFEVDSFTYRASFLLTDGTEALLLRGRFEVFYLYRHHHPTVSEHVMSVTLGFYYGKTILGRHLLTNVTIDSLSFLPRWHDSAGYSHGPDDIPPLFEINGSLADGAMVGGSQVIDDNPVSRYIPDFGGILVLRGLRLVLSTEETVSIGSDELRFSFSKRLNNHVPEEAQVLGVNNTAYAVGEGVIALKTNGQPPIIIITDTVTFGALVVAAAIASVVTLPRLRGRLNARSHLYRESV